MELQYYGGNCVRITAKKASIIIDDTLEELGQKSITKSTDIALFTLSSDTVKPTAQITIDMPGEYEVSNVSVKGVAARAHIDTEGAKTATIYRLIIEDMKVVILGHVYPELSDDQLEAVGVVDVLILPIGGNGYTLDGIGALKMIKKFEPKLIIPTHYADPALHYEVPQAELKDALHAMSMEPTETVAKLKLKAAELPQTMQLVVLERQ